MRFVKTSAGLENRKRLRYHAGSGETAGNGLPARRLSPALTGPNDQRRKPADNGPELYQQKDHKLDPPFQLRVEGPGLFPGLSRLKPQVASPGNPPNPQSAGRPIVTAIGGGGCTMEG